MGTGIGLLIALAVLASVWLPVVARYRVETDRIDARAVSLLRELPADAVLGEVAAFPSLLVERLEDAQKVEIAEEILRGRLAWPGYPPIEVSLRFDARDLEKGNSTIQLLMAGMVVPEVLLDASVLTGDPRFFDAAREFILGLAGYERTAWLPRGYLWNDHAVAARVAVLVEFWRLYRHHPSFTLRDATTVLQLAARSARMLSEARHFNYRTNHGLMQNLALLELATAFPELPGIRERGETAVGRIGEQLGYYVDDEGVVLEHSAGYQEFGVIVMGATLRCLTLMGIPAPRSWVERYERAKAFYAALRRPDATLPLFGDSTNRVRLEVPTTTIDERGRVAPLAEGTAWRPARATLLTPVAGYAVWWDGLESWPREDPLSQTVSVWADFAGGAHKHADEMSVLVWAAGQSWWTGVGYWPYYDERRDLAVAWAGSNAPHAVGEPEGSDRRTVLLSSADSPELAVLDLRRTTADGYAVRRQILHLRPDLWVVLDHPTDDRGRATREVWTTFPGVEVRETDLPGRYALSGPESDASLVVTFVSPREARPTRYRGSERPFAGWVAPEGWIREAPAFELRVRPGSWSAVVSSLRREAGPVPAGAGGPAMEWEGPDRWRLTLPDPGGGLAIQRDGAHIGTSPESVQVDLEPGPDVAAAQAELERRYRDAREKYDHGRGDLLRYRVRVSILLVAMLALQELFFFALRRADGRLLLGLRLASVCAWGGVASWLYFVYFGS